MIGATLYQRITQMKTKHYRLQWLDGDEWHTDKNKYYTLEDAKVALEYHKMQYTHLEARIVRVVVKTKVEPIEVN